MVFLHEFVPRLFKQHQSLIFKFMEKNNFSMVDVGTGTGKVLLNLNIEKLLPKNHKEIMGTDKSESMIEYFDSVPKDPRITGKILDISSGQVPEDLKGRFDFVCSSFCFGFVPDLRKAFKNCNHLLKPQGETFFAWSTRSHMPEVFRSLSKMEKWAPYTSDYRNWKSLIEYDDPIGTLQDHLKVAGLNILKIEEHKDFVLEDTEEVLLELYESLDHILHRIPQTDQRKYKEDFNRIVGNEQLIYEEAINGRKKIPCPAVTVMATKH